MRSEGSGISRREFIVASTGVSAGLVGLKDSADAKSTESLGRTNHIRVAACQILTYSDLKKSAQKIIKWMNSTAKDGVDVVVFPEACLCGYQPGNTKHR